MILKFKKLYEDAQIPKAAHPGDAGIDLRAYIAFEDMRGDIRKTVFINPKEKPYKKYDIAISL
jgi:dUTPase